MRVHKTTCSAALIMVALAACGKEDLTGGKLAAQAERQLERGVAALDVATVTAKVKAALIADDGLKGLSIDVDTAQNVVTLRGTVATDELRRRAEKLARGIDGVKEVANQLMVKQQS